MNFSTEQKSLSCLSRQRRDFLWQRVRDSNPRKRSQSPVCYRYTNPLSCMPGWTRVLLYTGRGKSQELFSNFPGNIFPGSGSIMHPAFLPRGRASPSARAGANSGMSLPPPGHGAWSGYSQALFWSFRASAPALCCR